MWTTWTLSVVVLSLVTRVSSTMSPLVAANNDFSVRMYKRVIGVLDDENAFFSPFNVATSLAMTSGGAKGRTASEINKALGFEKHHVGNIPEAFKRALDELKRQNNAKFTATLANGLFLDKRFKLRSEFVTVATDAYVTTPKSVDFSGAAIDSRSDVNTWAANVTEQKIKDLLTPRDISTETTLLLANANYLEGSWQTPFDKSKTTTQPFHVMKGLTIDVAMMETTGMFRFSESSLLRCQLVELPYAGTKLSMLLVLPRIPSELAIIESRLNDSGFINDIDGLPAARPVTVTMPKFNITQRFDVVQTLSNMGIQDLFTPRADLSGVAEDSSGLSMSGVAHKSHISVSEQGSDAALSGPDSKTNPGSLYVHADRPFMFIIRDTETGRYVFMGRYIQPSREGYNSISAAGHLSPAAVAWFVSLVMLLVVGHAL